MNEEPADIDLAAHWLGALEHAAIVAELESIYADVSLAIASRGPSCWASGRCCNFRATGHRLFVTGIEAAYCVRQLPLVAGTRPENTRESHIRPLALQQARTRGDCPLLVGNLCGVHGIKPLGCRVYFCDQSAQAWQQELSEEMLTRLRGLHREHGIAYRYGEWLEMLQRFVEAE